MTTLYIGIPLNSLPAPYPYLLEFWDGTVIMVSNESAGVVVHESDKAPQGGLLGQQVRFYEDSRKEMLFKKFEGSITLTQE
jgi:hypothetical protein